MLDEFCPTQAIPGEDKIALYLPTNILHSCTQGEIVFPSYPYAAKL